MKTLMNLDNLTSIDQLAEFLSGTQAVAFSVLSSPVARYEWVQKTLVRFGSLTRSRPHQGIVIRVLMKVSGYSRQQITRLIAQYRKNGTLRRRQRTVAGFLSKYTPADIRLLAAMDERHDTPCGPAVKKLCERAWRLFGQTEYERLASISVSHLYNLRKSLSYTRHRRHFEKTRPRQVPIGERRKPASNGQPGYLRIDTVHQGDWDGKKGVYHVNAVDEVTQCEVVCTLEKISESYLIPVLEQLLEAFPFTVLGFHSDNVLNASGGYSNRQSHLKTAPNSQKNISVTMTPYPAVTSTHQSGSRFTIMNTRSGSDGLRSSPYLKQSEAQWKVRTLSTRSLRPQRLYREGSIHWAKLQSNSGKVASI